jgi:leucyl-tRNA synthetase
MLEMKDIEKKWQEKWYAARINEANADERPKFMIIFAYPGVTGYLHVGHMRGYTYVDAMARYMRMLGYNVMFPVGTHATGNGPISLASRVKKGDENTLDYLRRNGCPEEALRELTDPARVVEFFNSVYVQQYWRRFGFLVDWRRFTCTLYPDYSRFIQWQFRKLMESGLLIQKPYYAAACVVHGPVAIDASETDIQCGGNAETTEYTLMKFKADDLTLIAATLRPETVFGQTNFWANPDVEYRKVRVGDEVWVVSQQAAEKLRLQKDGTEALGVIQGRDLVGMVVRAPMTGRTMPVLPARFCDPAVGTGLVVSVPSDAPDDWIALKNLQDDDSMLTEFSLDKEMVRAIQPVAIIETKGWGPMPAVEIVEKMGITRSGDPRLEDAKKVVYKEGFHQGRMNDACGKFAGMPVEKAKEQMKQEMLDAKEADLFYDLSEEVICRCGEPVLIKRVDDQWFIDYANAELTAKSKAHAREMNIMPGEFHANIQGILDWFRERACVRQGNWLGTRFPFDEKWIIEAISDSTLYPIYYIIAPYVNDGSLLEDQLTEEFFDHVFLGRGDAETVSRMTGVDAALLRRIRADVIYWYPLDINLGGKEHMTVHFPAFLMNHVAILPQPQWPRGIFVNWYVIGKGGKISKSKGGAQPIPGAADYYGVDALRLYYANVASPFADVEWDEDVIITYVSRVEKVLKTFNELKDLEESEAMQSVDLWLSSRLQRHLGAVRSCMKGFDLRQMSSIVYFEMLNDLRWYARRGGSNGAVLRPVLSAWAMMMGPITPHLAEEASEMMGGGMVAASSLPGIKAEDVDLRAEAAEDYLRKVLEDINEILKVTKISARRIVLYTTPSWKVKVLEMGLGMSALGDLSVPSLTKAAMADAEIRSKGKEASDFARKVAEDLMKRSSAERNVMMADIREFEYLQEASGFMEAELSCPIKVFRADDEFKDDPQKKSRTAQPFRPGIFVE